MTITISLRSVSLHAPVTNRSRTLKSYLITKKGNPLTSQSSILSIPSFEASLGDKICVIGRNGNGKTTFLKVLAGIYPVTTGKVWVKAKPTIILASGIGLEEELTVSENIDLSFIYRSVQSHSLKELKHNVITFCELERQIDTQYKHLSSGFKSRLAFAIATCENPDILILDEVLGGGDEFFMKKARSRVVDIISSASTAFVCTHAPDEMIGICNRCIVFDNGRITFDGSMEDGIYFYRRHINLLD